MASLPLSWGAQFPDKPGLSQAGCFCAKTGKYLVNMPPRAPPLNSLRAFEAAARHGSFVRAAAELHLTAAAISHHVRELESALSMPLFERKVRGVRLTEAGSRYQAEVARALHLIEQATANLTHIRIEGPLRVAMPQSFAQRWLVPRLARLGQRFPGLQLQLLGDNRLTDLRAGNADLAVRFGTGEYPGLATRYLMGDAVGVLVATEQLASEPDPRVPAVIERSVLLEDDSVGPGEPWMTWGPWLREAGVGEAGSRHRLRFSDSGLAIGACQARAGICIGRTSLVIELLRMRQLTLLMPWRSSEFAYHLVMRTADRDNPRLLAFEEWLVAEARQHLLKVEAATGLRLRGPTDGEKGDGGN